MDDLYRDYILEHYRRPHNFGVIDDPTASFEGSNPLCGDRITLQLGIRDGVVEPNLVWKDTVLVPTGQTVDILLEVTNPGRWMAHCHIAEHHESGMMFSFNVDP